MPHLRPATTSPNSRALTPPETGATFTRVHVAGNNPYTPEEREEILAHFRGTHWFAFVFFQFWQGPRPSETTALRRRDVDLKYETASIHKSRVAGAEAGAKTKKSRRTVRLHPNTVKVLRDRWPIGADPDDYVFTTPGGAPIDEQNFGSSPK
jgi:integrase